MTTQIEPPVTLNLPPTRKSVRKAKGDGYLRRAEILRVAERIFLTEGYERATIRKIAEEVGVSSTALYMHFRDKDQILLEICIAAMEQLLAANSEISSQPIDAVTRVRLMLEAYVRFALDNPNAYRLVFCSSPLVASVQNQRATMEIGTQCFERFSGVIREIAGEGRLRIGDIETAHQVLWAACHGMISLMITKPDFPWARPEEFTRVMIDGLLFGLIAD
jgi:AcrR family transcriptional regulator